MHTVVFHNYRDRRSWWEALLLSQRIQAVKSPQIQASDWLAELGCSRERSKLEIYDEKIEERFQSPLWTILLCALEQQHILTSMSTMAVISDESFQERIVTPGTRMLPARDS